MLNFILFDLISSEIRSSEVYVVHGVHATAFVDIADLGVLQLIGAEVCTLEKNVVHGIDFLIAVDVALHNFGFGINGILIVGFGIGIGRIAGLGGITGFGRIAGFGRIGGLGGFGRFVCINKLEARCNGEAPIAGVNAIEHNLLTNLCGGNEVLVEGTAFYALFAGKIGFPVVSGNHNFVACEGVGLAIGIVHVNRGDNVCISTAIPLRNKVCGVFDVCGAVADSTKAAGVEVSITRFNLAVLAGDKSESVFAVGMIY